MRNDIPRPATYSNINVDFLLANLIRLLKTVKVLEMGPSTFRNNELKVTFMIPFLT